MTTTTSAEDRERQERLRQEWEGGAWHGVEGGLCPALYRNSDPASLPAVPLAKVLDWRYGAQGLVAHGDTGRGKTRAMWLLLRRLHFGEGRKIVAFSTGQFAHECARRFAGDGDGPHWIERLARTDIVFFDDLGNDRVTERVESELFGVVERRIANCLPLLITTNHIGDTLAAKFTPDTGAALVRRLREFCLCVVF